MPTDRAPENVAALAALEQAMGTLRGEAWTVLTGLRAAGYDVARIEEGERLRAAAQAYIDWRDKRVAQWEAVARHDHEHGMTPCPEWDELTSEPFDIDQRLDDDLRAALAASDEAVRP